MHVRQLASWSKSWTKKCFFCAEKAVKHLTFAQCLTCWLGECFCISVHTWACLIFFYNFPHLVLTIFSPSFLCFLSDILFMSSSSLCFPLVSCVLFFSFCASGIILLFGLPFVMCLVVCGSGCLWIWCRMVSSGSVFVCLLNWLCRKFSAVIGVGLICCLLCVIILPVLVTCILYDLL